MRMKERRRLRRTKQVAKQCFWYAIAFYVNWLPLTLVRILQTANSVVPFWLLLLASLITPIQGLPNFLVYLAPMWKKTFQQSSSKDLMNNNDNRNNDNRRKINLVRRVWEALSRESNIPHHHSSELVYHISGGQRKEERQDGNYGPSADVENVEESSDQETSGRVLKDRKEALADDL